MRTVKTATLLSSIIGCSWLIAMLLMQTSCANIVPPEGGKKDTTAPILVSLTPQDSLLNTRASKIVLHFNKFVEVRDLEKNMTLSPLLAQKPTVISYGKRVEIKIVDSLLKPNTTYIIALGNAIVDNREATPFGNFTYTFSTGSWFDSLQVSGQVFDAETGMPDSSATIVLYEATEKDSAILRKKPSYVGKTNASGYFKINSLPQKVFRIYALTDESHDYIYQPDKDKIGFIENEITPMQAEDSTRLTFNTFKAQIVVDTFSKNNNDTDSVKSARPPLASNANKAKNDKEKPLYKVMVDTGSKEFRSTEINKPLEIQLYTPLSELNTEKVYLSYDNNGVEVEAITKITRTDNKILIQPEWKGDKLYTLRLSKNWATDTAHHALLPDKYSFRTKRDDDYGIMHITIDSTFLGKNYLLFVYQEGDTTYLKPISQPITTLNLLTPGKYSMRLIHDVNKNGKWDTGDLFKKIQPEQVVPFLGQTDVKAGWEHEVDFVPPSFNKKKGGENILNRAGENTSTDKK